MGIFAAKLGCQVFAFEASEQFVAGMKQNLQLNNISHDTVNVHQMYVGDAPGSRIDEHVPNTMPIKVLKMDIDGMDPLAMRGASGILKNVDYVNLEFNQSKHQGVS